MKLNGLEKYKVSVSEKAIRRVIHDYTREAGVRNLERKLAGICRKVAFKIVKGKSKGAQVTEKNLEKYLGPVIYLDDDISLKSSVGVANGLEVAVTVNERGIMMANAGAEFEGQFYDKVVPTVIEGHVVPVLSV